MAGHVTTTLAAASVVAVMPTGAYHSVRARTSPPSMMS
jgi:hypothetical protein